MIVNGEGGRITGLNAKKMEQLKGLAKTCAKGACSDLATMLDIPIGLIGTECIYAPMYRMVGKNVRKPPGTFIILASDVKGVGRSRIILTLTKDDAAELVDRFRSIAPVAGRALVQEDKAALMALAEVMITNYLAPISTFLSSSFSTTPPVVTFDVVEGKTVPSKLVRLISGYELLIETHFIDRSRRVRGGVLFLPDEHLQRDLIEGLQAK